MRCRTLALVSLALVWFLLPRHACLAEGAAEKTDPRYPYRTDFANAQLPWYQLEPLKFPPVHSDHRVEGELVQADFIHRRGRFRERLSGKLMDFTLLPAAWIYYLNAPADLRDVPLGADLLFFLYQDGDGKFTKVAGMLDEYSITASHFFTYRLDEVKADEAKLLVTKQNLSKNQTDLGKSELLVNAKTRFWKGAEQIQLSDLAIGDALLVDLTGRMAKNRGVCTDVWVGEETHRQVTEAQRAKYEAAIKEYGMPAWIDRVDAKQLTVTILTDEQPETRKRLQALLAADFPIGKEVQVSVANDELRTYRPNVDRMRAKLTAIDHIPADGYGNSGVRLTMEPRLMIEGFRKGRFVRLSAETWKVKEMPFGQSLWAELHSAEVNELAPKEYPAQFPYRTDYSNVELPWYRLKAGETPPRYSEHRIFGELVKVDAENRTGQFRAEHTNELVNFTLIPQGALLYINSNANDKQGPVQWTGTPASVRYLNTEAGLNDLPLGLRYCFHLYQDDQGAFTQVSLITDEFTDLAVNKVVHRITALNLGDGKLEAARLPLPTINVHLDMVQPPEIGCSLLLVDDRTRVWKGGRQAKLTDLAVGDDVLVNFTGETAGAPSRCADIWVGADAQSRATEEQRKKRAAAVH